MRVIGQFRDLDRADRFVWLRGFPDMERRRAALAAFYSGPVWKAHASTANATMIDTDDVLLLRPVVAEAAFDPLPPRPRIDGQVPTATVLVTICRLMAPVKPHELEQRLLPALAEAPSPALACFVDEPSENTYPALPVRTGEHVVVWLHRTSGAAGPDAVQRRSADIALTALPRLAAPPTAAAFGTNQSVGIAMTSEETERRVHDFDFLLGSWTVQHRRLRDRLVDATEWDTFTGTAVCRSVLAGVGNVDEIAMPTRGAAGMTVRLFDRDTGLWSLHWASSITGRFEPPVVGTFDDGVGYFYGDDVHDRQPIRVRFIWDHITPTSPRWQQAFSVDHERTWETNWIMTFTRQDVNTQITIS